MIRLTFFSLLFTVVLHAQGFEWGMRIEPYIYSASEYRSENNYSEKTQFAELPSFYVHIGYTLVSTDGKKLKINLKPGILFYPTSYSGYELGAALRFDDMFIEDVYMIGGTNLHFVEEEKHGNSISEYTYSTVVFSLVCGAGYEITPHLSVDLAYHFAFNKYYGDTFVQLYQTFYLKKIDDMLKLGIQLSSGSL